MAVKNDNIIISHKDAKTSNAVQGKAVEMAKPQILQKTRICSLLTDLYLLEVTEANRNSYTAVIVEWQDIEAKY